MTSLSANVSGSGDSNVEEEEHENEHRDVLAAAAVPQQHAFVGVADLSQQPSNTHNTTASSLGTTIAGVMGNVLEWYDFALFGFFADIIGLNFFPPSEEDNNKTTTQAFVLFGAAFVMRPLGGLLIGTYGDKHGRKAALTRSLFLMAIPTTLMGLLPTYAQIGITSTILLCVCRLVQGISVGGQLPASLVYTVEQRPRSQWGYYGSLPMVAANIGTLLGNLCAALLRELLTEAQLVAWGWRLPFLSGILIAGVALYLQKYGTNQDALPPPSTTPAAAGAGATAVPSPPPPSPIKAAFRKGNRIALLSTCLVPMIWSSGFYVSFIWLAIYMEELMDPPIPHAFWINAMALLVGMTVLLPIAGSWSDRVGRLPVMTVSALLLVVTGPFCLLLISKGNPWVAYGSQLMIAILLSCYGGPLCAWLVENFSPEVRMTSASFGYDISHAIAGGFSPAIATALYTASGSATAAGLVYVVFGILSVIGIYINYCFGCGDKEADTGMSSGPSVTGDEDTAGTKASPSLEMQHTSKIV